MEIKNISLDFLGHSGFMISTPAGKKIAIDPYKLSGNIPQADLILITHSHYDHCSIADIQKLSKLGTTLLIPADAQSKITRIENINMQIIEAGEVLEFGTIKIEALPAYNIKKDFHPKSEGWLGFLIKIGEVIIYHAGDTDRIPEMDRLTGYGKHENTFVTLLPVSGTYVMDPHEAAEVASLLKADIAIPMHYGSGVAGSIDDANAFVSFCKDKNINAIILDKL